MVDFALRRMMLAGFRSISFQKVDFDNPTFVVGRNGSGKSNFADAFALLSEAMVSPLQGVIEQRGGFAAVSHRSSARGRPSNLTLRVELINPASDTTGADYYVDLRPRRGYDFEVASELCSVRRVDRRGAEPIKFEAFSMSDGTLRVLGLITAVFQRPAPSLLVVEEPEASIHPGALGSILDVLRLAGRFTQVVITTHSPEILDAKWIEDTHLRIMSWEHGRSRIDHVSEAVRATLRKHLMGAGELLRSNALTQDELGDGDAP